ncbi:MAG: hypothetical protein QNJ18_22715 [Xenococcaceae cyanobacterium MO_167.B52]|nr:hypothetical protein [Xenococcaceae cyanobacterium MO_167.B52]
MRNHLKIILLDALQYNMVNIIKKVGFGDRRLGEAHSDRAMPLFVRPQ